EAALAEVAGEAGGGGVVVFEEGGVAVDVAPEALAQDELGVRCVEAGVKVRTLRASNAVIGPEGLGAVGEFDRAEGRGSPMRRGEGDVTRRVPVLGEDDVLEA